MMVEAASSSNGAEASAAAAEMAQLLPDAEGGQLERAILGQDAYAPGEVPVVVGHVATNGLLGPSSDTDNPFSLFRHTFNG